MTTPSLYSIKPGINTPNLVKAIQAFADIDDKVITNQAANIDNIPCYFLLTTLQRSSIFAEAFITDDIFDVTAYKRYLMGLVKLREFLVSKGEEELFNMLVAKASQYERSYNVQHAPLSAVFLLCSAGCYAANLPMLSIVLMLSVFSSSSSPLELEGEWVKNWFGKNKLTCFAGKTLQILDTPFRFAYRGVASLVARCQRGKSVPPWLPEADRQTLQAIIFTRHHSP